MTFSSALIIRKLTEIKEYLSEAKNIFRKTDKEILGTIADLRYLERVLQLIVDGIIDINQHIIREKKLSVPAEFQGTFRILAENKIIPREFAEKISPAVGLRNLIVHQYEKVDKPLFVRTFRAELHDFDEYNRIILAYVETQDNTA